MKKKRILVLLIAVLSLMSLLFLASCGEDEVTGDNGDGGDTAGDDCEHKWTDWKTDGNATCTEDGTQSRKCPICKKTESQTEPDSATDHWFVASSYVYNGDATCKGDDYDSELGIGTGNGTETAKCALCGEAEDTRIAKGTALDHNYSRTPIEEESHNGYEVFMCLAEDCGHKQRFDRGYIDEDFEYCGEVGKAPDADTAKREFTQNTDAVLAARGEDGKYLSIVRGDGSIMGNTGFGIQVKPDYDLYRNNDYIISYDLYVTEETKDLVLLEGKKLNTVNIFAEYDADTNSVIVNGEAVDELIVGEWNEIAFVLDDAKATFDLYVNKYLVAKNAVYDKNESYYHATTLEYLGVRMVVEPRSASVFGIDNIKTAVGKEIDDCAGSKIEAEKEMDTLSVKAPLNIMGVPSAEWLEQYKLDNEKDAANLDKSYAFEMFEFEGEATPVISWQNFKSGVNSFNIKNMLGVEKFTISSENAADYPYLNLTGDITATVSDLTGYESVTIKIYCDGFSDELAAELARLERDGYYVMLQFANPNAPNGSCYMSCKVPIKAVNGWQEITVDFKDFSANRNSTFKTVTSFIISTSGWANNGIGVGELDNSNNNKNAADGANFKIASVSLNKLETASFIKPAEDCEHQWGEDVKVYEPSCYAPGFSVNTCALCAGEKIVDGSIVSSNEHNYETIKHVEADCDDNGYHSKKCTLCGNKVREEEEALGHTEDVTVIAPTCYNEGKTVHTCSVCGNVRETDVLPMLEHEWNEGEITTDPTCYSEGVKTFICIHNGADGCDGVRTEAVEMIPHTTDDNLKGEYVAADCLTDGYWHTTCTVPECGQATKIVNAEDPALGHDDGGEDHFVQDGDCVTEGYKQFTCVRDNCPNENNIVIYDQKAPVGEHSFDLVPDAETKQLMDVCSVCNAKKAVYTDKAPTYTDLLAAVKDTLYADMVITDEVDSIFSGRDIGTAGAYVQFCARTNRLVIRTNNGDDNVDKYVDWEMKTALNDQHAYANVFTKDDIPKGGKIVFELSVRLGTLGADGKYAASNWQFIDRGTTANTAGGNLFADFADITEEGVLTFRGNKNVKIAFNANNFTNVAMACDIANGTMDIYVDGKMIAKDVAIFASDVLAKMTVSEFQFDEIRFFQYHANKDVGLGSSYHIANVALYGADRPTAITGVDYCNVAGVEHVEDVEKAEVVTAPTCVTDGSTVRTCLYCDAEWSTTEPALGHSTESTFVETKEPTCVDYGCDIMFCPVCKQNYETAIVDALGHTWGDWTEKVAPTCNDFGVNTRTCTVCQATEDDDKVAKLKHIYELNGTVTVPATCFTEGTLTKACTYGCGAAKTETIPVREHIMVVDEEISTYNCETDGLLVFVCEYEDCDHTTEENMTATGHKFNPESGTSNWEVKIPATCYADGLRARRCVNPKCTVEGGIWGNETDADGNYLDNIDQMRLNKIAHVLDTENAEVIAPTASSQGYTRTKCVNFAQCGHYVDSDFVAAQSDFEFIKAPGGYYIVAYTGTGTEVTIPATYNGEPVIGIDPNLFAWDACGITKLTIESDNVLSGGDYGIFAGCNFDEVVLKSGVTYVPMGTFEGAVIGTLYCENADVYVEDIDLSMVEIGKTVYLPVNNGGGDSEDSEDSEDAA